MSDTGSESDGGMAGRETDAGASPEAAAAATPPPPGKAVPGARYFSGAFRRFTDTTLETRSVFRETSMILSALRAPLFTSLLGFLIFAFPGQTLEIYRLFIEDLRTDEPLVIANIRFVCSFLMLWITCYSLWYVSRVLTLTDEQIRLDLHLSDVAAQVGRWGPRMIGALPAFGIAIGMGRASIEASPGVQTGLLVGAGVALFIGLARLYLSWRRTTRDPHLYDDLRSSWLRVDRRIGLSLLTVALIAGLMTMPVQLTQHVGALTIMCFFLTALAFGVSQLTYINDRYAIPGVTLLILAMVAWSLFDLNDNHTVRLLEKSEGQGLVSARALVPTDEPLEKTFDSWLKSRQDRQFFQDLNKPYPVYVVAAQGGGLYAAYQASVFLARMQDACPNFAQHVFGVSGVSGGAVGATIFTALAKRHAENAAIANPAEGCGAPPANWDASIEARADAMLRQDFLTPLISALLFPDFFARFSPVPIPSFSRAIALENGFEQAWRSTHPEDGEDAPNALEDGLLSYWSPEGVAPALFINTTEADTGRRMILSPLPELGERQRNYAQLAWRDQGANAPDMRLSTAMILSARFPWITPAGSIDIFHRNSLTDEPVRRKARLVDGGYFENSGIETASDVLRVLQRKEEQGLIELHLIAFDLTEDRARTPTYALGELTTPIKALLRTRSARAPLARERARRAFDSRCRYIRLPGFTPPETATSDELCPSNAVENSEIWSVSLNDYEYDFQLGWILSDETLSRISRQLGSVSSCPLGDSFARTEEDQYLGKAEFETREADDAIAIHNSCIAWIIAKQLRGGATPIRVRVE